MTEYDSFVVRIWRSVGRDGQQWAGRLEHLQRAERLQFATLDALLEYLRAVAGPLAPITTERPGWIAARLADVREDDDEQR